jgi:hypothetical protein
MMENFDFLLKAIIFRAEEKLTFEALTSAKIFHTKFGDFFHSPEK